MAQKNNKYQRLAMDVLATKPIAFNPDLARALESITAALFLCQLLYWWKKGNNPEMIYKTVKEFEEETALSKRQQLNAQKICIRKGVLEVRYKQIPPKRHFKINFQRVCDLLQETGGQRREKRITLKWLKARQTSVRGGVKGMADLLPNITESIPESTPREENKKETQAIRGRL